MSTARLPEFKEYGTWVSQTVEARIHHGRSHMVMPASRTCCRQRTITIAGAVVEKVRQPLAWGSDDWIDSYSRRTHVEGIFGNVKSAKTADLQRGWIFIVGMRLRRWPGRNS